MDKIFAVLLPKQSLTSNQLKEMGQGILDWIDSEQSSGIGAQADPNPISDLLEGELPTPFGVNELELQREPDRSKRVGPAASARLVRISAYPLPEGGWSEEEFIHRLTLFVPAEYIDRMTVSDAAYTL